MIDLRDATLIGAGNERACYRHPLDPRLCIKVTKAAHGRQQNALEYQYLRSLRARGVPFEHLPECGEWCETSEGYGLIFEFIVDDDGQPSASLVDRVRRGELNPQQMAELLDGLREYLFAYGLVIVDINVDQMLYQCRAAGNRLVVIDGMGGRRPGFKAWLFRTSRRFARNKMETNWPRIIAAHREAIGAGME